MINIRYIYKISCEFIVSERQRQTERDKQRDREKYRKRHRERFLVDIHAQMCLVSRFHRENYMLESFLFSLPLIFLGETLKIHLKMLFSRYWYICKSHFDIYFRSILQYLITKNLSLIISQQFFKLNPPLQGIFKDFCVIFAPSQYLSRRLLVSSASKSYFIAA